MNDPGCRSGGPGVWVTGRLPLALLRRIKHEAFRSRRSVIRRIIRLRDSLTPRLHEWRPYRWNPESCPGSPQHGVVPAPPAGAVMAPRRIFCFWTGGNPLTANRERCLQDLMRTNRNIEVILVTPGNLSNWVVDEHPLHPAYDHLSFVHRSDYLRTYFMHYHGGGYSDLKSPRHNWSPVFDRLDAHCDWYAVGYREMGSGQTGTQPGRMGRLLRLHYHRLIGQGAYVFRPRTDLTKRWLDSAEAVLAATTNALREHPGGVWGDEPGYPLRWTELLGDVFHPWNLVYADYIGQDSRLVPDLNMAHYR